MGRGSLRRSSYAGKAYAFYYREDGPNGSYGLLEMNQLPKENHKMKVGEEKEIWFDDGKPWKSMLLHIGTLESANEIVTDMQNGTKTLASLGIVLAPAGNAPATADEEETDAAGDQQRAGDEAAGDNEEIPAAGGEEMAEEAARATRKRGAEEDQEEEQSESKRGRRDEEEEEGEEEEARARAALVREAREALIDEPIDVIDGDQEAEIQRQQQEAMARRSEVGTSGGQVAQIADRLLQDATQAEQLENLKKELDDLRRAKEQQDGRVTELTEALEGERQEHAMTEEQRKDKEQALQEAQRNNNQLSRLNRRIEKELGEKTGEMNMMEADLRGKIKTLEKEALQKEFDALAAKKDDIERRHKEYLEKLEVIRMDAARLKMDRAECAREEEQLQEKQRKLNAQHDVLPDIATTASTASTSGQA